MSELTTWETFVAAHHRAGRQIEDYLHPEYGTRVSLDRATRADLDRRAAIFLPANNTFARVRYAGIMAEQLERYAEKLLPETPVFLVTLINCEHTRPRRHGPNFDTAKVVGWTHALLTGLHYVGMVEAAYFSNLKTLGGPDRRYLSWHTHAIVWGEAEAEMAARIEDINRRFHTAVPGCPAAHFRQLQLEEVFGRALYISKGQISEYRVWQKPLTLVNPQTGEVREFLTRDYRVKKRPLRPGDAVHLCRVFRHRMIDVLAFAAGDGQKVLNGINRQALAEFRRWEDRQPYKHAEARRRAAAKRDRRTKRRST